MIVFSNFVEHFFKAKARIQLASTAEANKKLGGRRIEPRTGE